MNLLKNSFILSNESFFLLLLLFLFPFLIQLIQLIFLLKHIVDAVLAIRRPNEPIDLHMVEVMEMKHKTDMDTKWEIFI